MSKSQPVLDTTTVEKLRGVIDTLVKQYSADASSAQAEFRAQTRSVYGLETESKVRGFTHTIDEPEVLGGTDKGPNPVEVLLGSLGTCQEIVIVAYAAALGIELDAVKIDVRGNLDLRGLFSVAEVPSGFLGIRFDVDIKARSATPQQLEQLKALALAHCPVLDTLKRPIPVESVYRLSSANQAA